MSQKKANVANFNVVFLENDDEAPLLKYFESIVIPAFQSGIKKVTTDSEQFFMNVEVIEDEDKEYVLVGNIVKRMILEVKSDINAEGKLIEKDERYPPAPYSTFAIFLKNHRMFYALNQKGSPSLMSFSALTKYVFSEYIKRHNKETSDESKFLPFPIVSVVGLPMRSNIEEALRKVSKVNKLTLKFYPLNGDQNLGEMVGSLIGDLRKVVNCRNGEITLKSPKSISGIIDVIEKSEGTVIPIIDVTYPDKTKGKIKEDEISEKMELDFYEENISDMNDVVSKGRQIKSISHVSQENQNIYDKYKDKIIKFVPKR